MEIRGFEVLNFIEFTNQRIWGLLKCECYVRQLQTITEKIFPTHNAVRPANKPRSWPTLLWIVHNLWKPHFLARQAQIIKEIKKGHRPLLG